MGLHHHLMLLHQCRCVLPASMALARTLSHSYASSSAAAAAVVPGLLGGKPSSRCVKESWECWTLLRNFKLDGLERGFATRRFARVEKSRAALAAVEFSESIGTHLTDHTAQPGDGVDKGLKSMLGSNIVITAGAEVGRLALIKSADFIKSSSKESECPHEGHPEFALVGRSNVGKSSLINALVHRKELAQTSKKPGKTQLINHYLINKTWYLVDLPGYGYAKAPTAIRTDWNEFTKGYFLKRQTLVSVLLLVDSSIEPQQIDLDCVGWLGRNKIPVTIVFTKCDRKKKKKNGGRKPEENIKDFLDRIKPLYAETPPWIMTSSETNQGKEELLRHIAQLRILWAS
ncbi:GTP-binding protein At2g22870 [Physcomitrium patens]|uniref:EngB-type G domain-containing protein n=1 Tax=Physcomitrium patens TaxID=3218 RepID=A0A2K1JNS3_PHYPA|nr:GTP-binding protein At2g22870-like [Physcomitrium patens]PNR42956.1 hypothetical protein PHYPA_017788 [Physcomitrium patens]|eukprot:XP_024393459.1 GTP-binding protein At2g22870-like [Physcomitrella patens]